MFSKFLFTFHIFLSDGSSISSVDHQFVFDTLQQCRSAEMLIQKIEDPNNCTKQYTDQANNNSLDNLDMMINSKNNPKGENS